MVSEIAFCWFPAQGAAVDPDPSVASAGALASGIAHFWACVLWLGAYVEINSKHANN